MKKFIAKLFFAGTGFLIISLIFGLVFVTYYFLGLPKISSLADYQPPIPSKILSKDGTVLASIGIQKRDLVSLENVPQKIINAFLSAEDSEFYNHSGIDYIGVIRASIANLRALKIVQGGSTITQQVAKSLFLTRERSFFKKDSRYFVGPKN